MQFAGRICNPVLRRLEKDGGCLALQYVRIRDKVVTAITVIIKVFWIVHTDVSEEPRLHLPDTIVCRQQAIPKRCHVLTELHAAVCHKAVAYDSLNNLFSTSG